jgi:hypothetical protein
VHQVVRLRLRGMHARHRRAAAGVHAGNAATQQTRKQRSTQQRRRRTTRARRSQRGPHQGRRCCCLSPTGCHLVKQRGSAHHAAVGVHAGNGALHACAQARLPHSGSSGQLWDGSAACGCSRQQDEIRQGKRARTRIRCGCGCGRCTHATVVQQLQCTLAMAQHSRPVSSGARSSVAVGQLVRGGVSEGRIRAVVAVV